MKNKHFPIRLLRFYWRVLAFIGGLLLAACSSGKPDNDTHPPITVQTAIPKLRIFHAQVAAFGQLAVDSRNALALSLPQAGRIVATRVLAGQRVKHGDALLKLETDPATRSAYLQAQNAWRTARDGLARSEHLHAEKLATNTQLDVARQALADAEAALAAQTKLGGAQVVTILRAPVDGVVTALDVRRGQRVTAGTALLQLTPAAALNAQLGVDPGAAADIHPGMPVTLKPVYAARGTPALHGTVAMMGDAVNPQSHLVDVVGTLNAHASLPIGTAVSGTIATAPFKAWAVPRTALQSGAEGGYLYQIERGKAQRVKVKVVAPDGSPIGVQGAIDPHAPVITLGSYEVSDGDPVRASVPGSAPQGTAAR